MLSGSWQASFSPEHCSADVTDDRCYTLEKEITDQSVEVVPLCEASCQPPNLKLPVEQVTFEAHTGPDEMQQDTKETRIRRMQLAREYKEQEHKAQTKRDEIHSLMSELKSVIGERASRL